MKDTNKQSKELATTDSGLTDFKSFEEIQAWAEKIVKSQLTPLKEAKDVVVAILFGRELGMSPMISVNNIYPINGKGTLSVHMINALLQTHGVVLENVRQYEPCLYYALKGDDGKAAMFDGNGNIVKRNGEGNIPDGVKATPMILREGFADETPGEHEVRGNKIINYKTIIKLTRKLKQIDGSFKEMSIYSSYSYAEARDAGLLEKDNWKKYPKQMCHARALAFGGRMIAADLMLGMYETSELADNSNLKYTVTEDMKVEIITDNNKKTMNTNLAEDVVEIKEEGSITTTTNNPSDK